LFFSNDFSYIEKKANYEYYEARCIHESSLSPSVHSILAAELDKKDEAFNFFEFATRLDLDNYNRNTREGLHITSISAAWLNIVYGFCGMRSDGDRLSFKPSIPKKWKSFSCRLTYKGANLMIRVEKKIISIKSLNNLAVEIEVFDKLYKIDGRGIEIQFNKEP